MRHNLDSRKLDLLLLLSLGGLLLTVNCSEPVDGGGPYYQHLFWDSTGFRISADSVTILLEEFLVVPQTESLRVAIVSAARSSDLVWLKYTVYGGSRDPVPAPYKYNAIFHDTLYLWYASVPYDSVHAHPPGFGKPASPQPPVHFYIGSLVIEHLESMTVQFSHQFIQPR